MFQLLLKDYWRKNNPIRYFTSQKIWKRVHIPKIFVQLQITNILEFVSNYRQQSEKDSISSYLAKQVWLLEGGWQLKQILKLLTLISSRIYHKFANILQNMQSTKPRKVILLLIVTCLHWLSTSTGISLADPFLASNSYGNVNSIVPNKEGQVFVALDNGETMKFDPALNFKGNLDLGITSDKLQFSYNSYSIQLQDSSYFTGYVSCLSSRDSSGFVVSVYDYSTYVLINRYTFNETVRAFHVFPVNVGTLVTELVTILTTNQMKVMYSGIPKWSYQYSTVAGAGATLTSITNSGSEIITYYNNLLVLSANFHISLSNQYLYSVEIRTTFNHNAALGQLEYQSTQQVITYLQSFMNPLVFIGFNNDLIFMQESNGDLCSYYKGINVNVNVHTNIPRYHIQQFLQQNGRYFLLQNNQFIEIVLINLSLNVYEWQLISLLTPLPMNDYHIMFISPNLALLFVTGSPYIYKAGECLGNTLSNGTLCQAYSCADPFCVSCPLNADTCSKCALGYQRSAINYACVTSYSNSTLNESIAEEDRLTVAYMVESVQEAVVNTIQIPGARRLLTPIFFYFGNFDDLFFYQFHDRQYGPTMNYVFDLIGEVEFAKWSIINTDLLLNTSSSQQWSILTNQRSMYLTYNFTSGKSQGSEGLFENSFNFFVITVPLTTAGYILCRVVWFLLRSFRVSRFLKQFGLGLFLVSLLFEGNIQQFSFYLSAEFSHLFAFDFNNKGLNLGTTIFGWMVMLVSVGGVWMGIILYGKDNRCLMQNYKNHTYGVFWLTLFSGVRNIVFGTMQYFLRRLNYQNLLLVLLFMQSLFGSILVYLATEKKVFHFITKVWFIILLTILRILLQITFLVDYYQLEQNTLELSQQIILSLMISIFLFGFIFEVMNTLREMIKKMRKSFLSKNNDNLQKDQIDQVSATYKQNKLIGLSKPIIQKIIVDSIPEQMRSEQKLSLRFKKKATFRETHIQQESQEINFETLVFS